MAGFSKLFSSIVTSTIWREDDKTRILWITMLALTDANGVVEGSVPGLGDMARMTTEECRASLLKLSSPDPDSRTKDFEGRRIEEVEGGWRILNYAKYRNKGRHIDRKEYLAMKNREYRLREKKCSRKSPMTSDDQSQPKAEAEKKLNSIADKWAKNLGPAATQKYLDEHPGQGVMMPEE